MRPEFLWSLIGGIVATVFNVIYNYVRETRNRRCLIASEICGLIDFYYHRLVKATAHLESVYDDQVNALTQEEWRNIQIETSPIFTDDQKIRAEIDIVFGINSYESNQFDEVLNLIKNNIELAMSISDKDSWSEKKQTLLSGMNKIATIRPNYRKKLVEKSRLWPILTSKVN